MLTLPELWGADCASEPRMPLLGLSGRSLQFSDPVAVADQLSSLLPVRSCDPVQPVTAATPFRCHMGGLPLGPLGIVAVWGTGLEGQLEDPEMATLVVPFRGRGHFRIDHRSFVNLTGRTLLLIPPGSWRTRNDWMGGLTIRVAPAILQSVARAMVDPREQAQSWLGLGCSPRLLAVDDPSQAVLFARLYRLLAFLDGVVRRHGVVPAHLRLDDLLLRQIVTLLAPGPLQESDAHDPPDADVVFDALIDWMHAHCYEPISLTELEQRAHYSRRHLQYAFKARFGCGPMQYLRRLRLWRARRRLERAEPGSTLSGIALACGYLSLESFRRDFRRRFGVAPSLLLAQGRRRG